jgi:hypothetical protein
LEFRRNKFIFHCFTDDSQVNYARTIITIHHHYTEDNQTKEVAAAAEHSKQPKLVLQQDQEL